MRAALTSLLFVSLGAAVAIALDAASARAEWKPDLPEWAPELMFSGFGTLGVVYSSEGDADFVNQFQPTGAGHTHRWHPGPDSRLGAQLDVRINDELSLIAQGVAQHRYDDKYWPVLEWANLKYEFTPEFNVRIGRSRAATFMLSDTRLVGFSYPWVRPPVELYGLVSQTNRDGIDAAYQLRLGSWTHSLGAGYGFTTAKLPDGGEFLAKHFVEATDAITHGPFTFRLGYTFVEGSLHIDRVDLLFDGLRSFGRAVSANPGLEATGSRALSLADRYEPDDIPISVFSLGAMYDPGTWLLMAEIAHLEGSAMLADSTAWYVTGGYRIGPVTPYVTYAQLISDPRSSSGISTAGLPPPVAQPASGLSVGLNQLLAASAFEQITYTAGIRWDLCANVDLKLQYDHIDLRGNSAGRLTNIQPGFDLGGKLDLFSATLDFVF